MPALEKDYQKNLILIYTLSSLLDGVQPLLHVEIMREAFHGLLRENFRSGFDPASIIDRKKFARAFAAFAKLESFEPNEALLREEATRACLEWEGKFYAIDGNAWKYLADLFETLRQEGTNLVNLDVLFKKFGADFLKLGIISPSLLKEYMRQKMGIAKNPNFLRLDPAREITSEFSEKLADVIYLPQKDMAALFPFLTESDVTRWAVKTLHYKTLRNGDLYLPSAVEFDEEEWQREITKVKRVISEQGYLFYKQLDLSKTRANNPDLPEAAFIDVLNNKLEALSLKKRGAALIHEGKGNVLPNMVREYCRKATAFSLASLEVEFGPDIHAMRHLIEIAQNEALQIAQDQFVRVDSVAFRVYETDLIIRDYFNIDFFPIISFQNFDILPSLEQYSWNIYLFHSYICHRSRRFKLIKPTSNNKCIGIVYDREKINSPIYYKLVAQAAIHDGVEPSPDTLPLYLKQKGFIDRARESVIASVIEYMGAMA